MTKTSFGDQLQQMWHTRPVRLPRQGPIAGVATGFGRRYHIDPVLIRVAFVVSTLFGGAGIVLYLAGWLLLNQEGDDHSPAESLFGRGASSQSPTKTIVLIVALAIAATTVGPVGMGLAGSGVISLALMLAGWWMLHMRTPQPPPGTSALAEPGFDGGLTATGYPGTAFPVGGSGSFYAPDNPATSMYSPYTKLPDTYVPDPYPPTATVDSDTGAQVTRDTVTLRKGEDGTVPGEDATNPPSATAAAADSATPGTATSTAATDTATSDTTASGTTVVGTPAADTARADTPTPSTTTHDTTAAGIAASGTVTVDSAAVGSAPSRTTAATGTTAAGTPASGTDGTAAHPSSTTAPGGTAAGSTTPDAVAAVTGAFDAATSGATATSDMAVSETAASEETASGAASSTEDIKAPDDGEDRTPGTATDVTSRGADGSGPARSAPDMSKMPPRNRGSVMDAPTRPSWDPLGVAPMAWDLPEPAPARPVVAPPRKRPRSRLTSVVIGLSILAAAGAGAAAASGVEWMTPARIGAVALAVIGLGLIVGAFLRRGYGLLVVTAPLAAFVFVASLIGTVDFDESTMGDRTWTPATMTELDAAYHVSLGSGTLDLRSLQLTENRAVEVSVQMGSAEVLLPQGMTVRTECTVKMGDQSCPTGISGPNTPGAPVLDLTIDVNMGDVKVRRG
ncbi:PspC domain-containing protein [Nocardia bovistercoris]|uniref:PspC domain-containing protein n=1 Tax=Nocardia bovistercoris TaxID=2785916 RepID=UPI002FCD4A8C